MEGTAIKAARSDNDPIDQSDQGSKLSQLPVLMPSEEFSRTHQANGKRGVSSYLMKLVSRIVK